MAEYGKVAAWQKLGVSVLKYGLIGIIVSFITGFFIGVRIPLMPWTFLSGIMIYSPILALPLASIMFIENRYRDVRDFHFFWELIAVLMVIMGFGAPLTIAGLLILGMTSSDIDGIEKWLPQIEDRAVFELRALQNIVFDLKLSENTQEDAELMLEEARDKGVMKGRSFKAILGGIIYIAARDNHEPRTLNEISESLRISTKDLGNSYRYVGRELEKPIVPPPPEDYIPWFAEKLELSEETAAKAQKIAEKAEKQNIISGKSSSGVAAAALYIAADSTGETRSMKDVADTLDVTTVTIRQRGRDLVDQLGLENPPDNMKSDRSD